MLINAKKGEDKMELVIIAIIVYVVYSLNAKSKQNNSSRCGSKIDIPYVEEYDDSQIMPYRFKYILTKNEYYFYKFLKPITDKHNCIICPKIGLKDIVDITDRRDYKKWFAKVSQKHVDFVICDSSLKPLFAIELDDRSHYQESAKVNDDFKNELFIKIGLPLKRVLSSYRYDELEEYLYPSNDI